MSDTITLPGTVVRPKEKEQEQTKRQPPYNVVLINDDDHSFEYVIGMLQRLFGYPPEKGYKMAWTVHTEGRVIVLTTTWLGIAVLWIAALGFIGVGVQPPLPEWGAILNDGQNYITLAWWITVFPGVFLASLVIGVNLIGDSLRDQLDPTLARF